MDFEFIKYEKKDHLAYITINRPEVMNSLHPPANLELDKAVDDFAEDPDSWVAIYSGAGEKAFSAGNDLKFTAEQGYDAVKKAIIKGGFGGITSRYDCFKPLIAAVNGFALGGGFEIVMACDIVVAADHASFGLPEPRVGLLAGALGVHRLPRQIPLKLAMGMMMTGKRIPAQQALEYGIVNEVVPAKDLMSAAEKWAAEILECAPLSVRASKQCALEGLNRASVAEAFNAEYSILNQAQNSEDWVEGPKAFAEKRKPQWKGR